MTITTNRGKTFEAVWAWAMSNTNQLMMELRDTRPIYKIAKDFDGLTTIDRKSEEEGDATYTGYDTLVMAVRDRKNGTVRLTLERSDAA